MARIRTTQADLAGNTFGNARNLGLFRDNSVIVDDAVGVNDRADFYRFTVARRCTGTIALTGLRSNVDVEVYDQNRRRVNLLNRAGTASEFTTGIAPRGVYYLKVVPRGAGETTYRLTVLTVKTS
ncbi:hypothetical protein H6G89_18120 [Oscillatoria sp. FACHB-1407]|uniref:hypothetical protein n=1 Tax=Oscillatoria sp. FACHB-1407 TaxID=2692847 RepID=UPI0016849D1C|nr:hypothetical protein [Oscillatoria sp. FACHB-1407]MBD2462959.1 hypothetical protein [Oscillatoria sp. FACHB-1407]